MTDLRALRRWAERNVVWVGPAVEADLHDDRAYAVELPRVRRRDQYDYPKVVAWHAARVVLERLWCLADRPCVGCKDPIAAHTFYVRVVDHARLTGPFIRGRRLPAEDDLHPGCVPARLAPALLRLEVPDS